VNLLLLHLFARDAASRVVGAVAGTPGWLAPILSIPLRRRGGNCYLVIVVDSPGPFCFVRDENPLDGVDAPERFEHLKGLTVTVLSQHDGDRMLRIEVGADDEGRSHALLLHLYGARGRAVLLRDGVIIESLRGRDREEAAPLENRPVGLDRADANAVREAIDGEAPAQSRVPGLDSPLLDAFAAGDGRIDADALVAFRDDLIDGRGQYDLLVRRSPGSVVPVPHVDADSAKRLGPFVEANAACAAAGEAVLLRACDDIIDRYARPVRVRVAALEKLASHLESDISRSQDHGRLRREAEILAAYQSTVRPGTDRAVFPDIYDPAVSITIDLDPSESISAQIERRFRKATKLEKSRAHAQRRLELATDELGRIRSALSGLTTASSLADSLSILDEIRSRF